MPSVARKRAWVGITPDPFVGIVPVVILVVLLSPSHKVAVA